MLERYFVKPATVDRIRTSWIAEPIERYVDWLAEHGYAPRNVFRRVPVLVQFGAFAAGGGARHVKELPEHVDAFVDEWLRTHGGQPRPPARRKVAHFARGVVEQMLRVALPDLVVAGHRGPLSDPFIQEAPGFFPYLREERGLREASIQRYCQFLRGFEAYLQRIGCHRLGGLSPPVLSAFVTERAGTFGRSTMIGLCGTLRVFLRYLRREDVVGRDLARSIEPPQVYRLAELPRSISWDEVRRMLEAVDRRTPVGRRDYAILLLLITYGLRAREIASLTLDDVDWKRERLHVRERKADHVAVYPLSPLVGEAIVAYLKGGRPQTEHRCLFFRHLAPHVPLTHAAVSGRASHYLHKAGISVRRAGSHTLRHTCVQRLVDSGFPLKTIGDYVGHRSASSTEIYAKVAVETLRDIALGDGEALGLRVGEVARLTRSDVDLSRRLLVIRETKFGKSRLVPFGPRIAARLTTYINLKERQIGTLSAEMPAFSFTAGQSIHPGTISQTFHALVPRLGLTLSAGVAPPRVHDLRHSFAVGTLLRWYREGSDPAAKLLHLSTFLGHVNPASTATYLTITGDLLQSAGERFGRFAAPLSTGGVS